MNDTGDLRKMTSISDIPELSRSNVKMKDPELVLKKINDIIASQKDRLQVIMDFDLTMTKQHVNGKKTLSSFGILSLCKNLPAGFIEDDLKLKEKYYKIEINPAMTPEEKSPFMIKWYHESQKLWDGVEFDLNELRQVIQDTAPELRDGTIEMCKSLEHHQVPVLVLSAGLGNVVSEVLRYHGLTESDYFHVISNFLKLENGIVRGYGCYENGLFIHPFNKNGLGCSGYFQKLGPHRQNVIVLGDSLGDSHMDQGVPEIKTSLKIGLLYGTTSFIEECLPHYLQCFDIVLIDDQTMNVPRAILDRVLVP